MQDIVQAKPSEKQKFKKIASQDHEVESLELKLSNPPVY